MSKQVHGTHNRLVQRTSLPQAGRAATESVDGSRRPGRTSCSAAIFLGALFLSAPALPGKTALGQLPPPPVPPQNPITESKRVLGKILYWDEQLSSDNTMSCRTCHQPFQGFVDPRIGIHPGLDNNVGTPDDVFGSPGIVRQDALGMPISDPLFGTDSQVTPRSAPSVSNSLWSPEMFWDGRAGSEFRDPQTNALLIPNGGALENQAVGPIVNDVEMAHEGRTWDEVITKLSLTEPMAMASYLPPDMESAVSGGASYADLFASAFGDPTITAGRIGMAIATYERTLIPDQTPFDTGTMSPQQVQGFNGFLSPGARCSLCHQPPFFTDHTFRNIGLRPIPEDIGRQEVTGNPADAGRFKVPGLRNVGLRTLFMHNGRKTSLEQVLDFYIGVNGEQQFPQNQDPLIPPINMPPPVRANIIEFLRNGLTDPRVVNEQFPFDRPILLSERGDADRDDDVDGDDFDALVACFDGIVGGDVTVACRRLDMDADGNMTCADWLLFETAWTEEVPPPDFPLCAAAMLNVTADSTGSTSFEITLAGNPDSPFAVRVTGDGGDADISCIDLYLQADGTLDSTPLMQSLAAWGNSILINNEWIIPEATYTVATEGFDSQPVDVTTDRWCDVNGNGIVNLEDALFAVVAFQSSTYDPASDVSPCQSDGTVNLSDVLLIIQRWQGVQSYVNMCGVPCE